MLQKMLQDLSEEEKTKNENMAVNDIKTFLKLEIKS